MLRHLRYIPLYLRARSASRYARARGAPGLEFDRFGRELGLRLLRKGRGTGISYLLNPVSIVRYFEFPCAWSFLPPRLGRCLDVSSPRLFSFYVASKYPSASILMMNPDENDMSETRSIVQRGGFANVRTECCGVEILAGCAESYDCVWAISVVEHVSGSIDDQQSMRLMFDSLCVGGRMIVTVPVDRRFSIEYRDQPLYGIASPQESRGRYFFQRLYDSDALRDRLIRPIEEEPSAVRWFGETTRGRYAEYEKRWIEEGLDCTVEDPREIADHYGEFASWDEMPGTGVCCMMFEKKSATGR